MDIAQKIKNLRTEKNLTAAQLSDNLGLPEGTVSAWEDGSAEPTLAQLVLLSQYFSVTADYLLTGHANQGQEKIEPQQHHTAIHSLKNNLLFLTGILLMAISISTFALFQAIENVQTSIEYTLYRNIMVGEYAAGSMQTGLPYAIIILFFVIGCILFLLSLFKSHSK